MNLQQLEYLLAVDRFKHFGQAAKLCCVSQPTLSAMINKLEIELDVIIFDRSSHPIRTTDAGKIIIEHAKKIISETKTIRNVSANFKTTVTGKIKLGIIPTVASYLIPNYLVDFLEMYPEVILDVQELSSENIIKELKNEQLDVGIISTPFTGTQAFFKDVIFVEELLLYSPNHQLEFDEHHHVIPNKLDQHNIWLLEEDNCISHQFLQICQLNSPNFAPNNLLFKASNISTLVHLVDKVNGMSLVPELSINKLNDKQKQNIFHFQKPFPAREISFIYYKPTFKQKIIDRLLIFLQERILSHLMYQQHPEDYNIIKANLTKTPNN